MFTLLYFICLCYLTIIMSFRTYFYTTHSSQRQTLWLKQYQYLKTKISAFKCHVPYGTCSAVYVITCLSFGITPKGLKLKFPIHGVPPSVRVALQSRSIF